MSERPHEADERVLDGILDVLMSDFDSVQIICTRVNADGDTECIDRGRGNYFARLGALSEFLIRNDERTRKHVQSEDEQ